jgi:hypothetical protein
MPHEVTFRAIAGFRLVTAAPDRLAAFYQAIGFDIGARASIPAEEMAVLGLKGRGSRRAMMLGASCVELDDFDLPGHAYPPGAKACDTVFHHLALVTDDADAAWLRARGAGAVPISRSALFNCRNRRVA